MPRSYPAAHPEQVGFYRIISPIYSGQDTRLYKAFDEKHQRPVALKTLLPAAAKKGVAVRALQREFSVGKRLLGENLVRVYDFGKCRGEWFLAIEWIPAPSVKQLIHLGYDNYAPVLPELIPLLFRPLSVLNDGGWVHRDIKPDNFLYSPELGIKLIDFGLTQKRGGFWSRLFRRKGVTQGTATYMAPEQIRNQSLDGRTDLYSLGCSIFELATGTPPYTGNSVQELLNRHISGPIPSISARNKNFTPEFSAFVVSLMAKKASDRPASAKDALAMLGRIRIFLRPPELNQ